MIHSQQNMPPVKPKIIVIVGQTASGKTALSLEVAKHFSGEVINADSRQIYKGLNIGTEKITPEEMEGITHHLLSIISPEHAYSAQQFKEDADSAIAQIVGRNHLPIITGGTFFYVDVLLRKMVPPMITPNLALREELEQKDTETLFSELEAKDPVRASAIDPHNKRRIMRALEILDVLPSVPKQEQQEDPYDPLVIGISADKKVLRERLRARAVQAVDRGLFEETEKLLSEGVTKERLSEIGLEYKLVLLFLDGTITKDQLIQKLEEKNWQYAKRQFLWLKRDSSIEWFKKEDQASIMERITEFLCN